MIHICKAACLSLDNISLTSVFHKTRNMLKLMKRMNDIKNATYEICY